MNRCDLAEREIRERRGQRSRPELRGWASELAPCAGVGDVGGGEDGNTPRQRNAAAKPKSPVLAEPKVNSSLDVDLIGAQRAIVNGAARVADHFGAHAVHRGRRERAGHDAVRQLNGLLGEKSRATCSQRCVWELESNGGRESEGADGKGAVVDGILSRLELRSELRRDVPGTGNQQRCTEYRDGDLRLVHILSSFGSPAAPSGGLTGLGEARPGVSRIRFCKAVPGFSP